MEDTRIETDTFAEIVALIGPEERKCEHKGHSNQIGHKDGPCDWLYQFECVVCKDSNGVIRVCNAFAAILMSGTVRLVCTACKYKHPVGSLDPVKILEMSK